MDDMKKHKGLAGLSTMVTDVKAIEQSARSQSENAQTNVCDEGKTHPAEVPLDKSSQHQRVAPNRGFQLNGHGRLVALELGLVFMLFFFFGLSDGKKSTSSKTQPTRNTTTTTSSPTYSRQSALNPSPKPTQTPVPKPVPEILPMPVPAPNTKPTVVQKTPVQVLQAFHQNITNKRYRKAYNYLSEDFQDSVSYEGWAPGFRTTVSSTVSNVKIISQTDSQVVLTYILKAVDNPGGIRYFQGTATFIKTSDGWKIDEIMNKAR